MGLFRPREPCPHCGKKVRQPKDSTQFACPDCGRPGPWASAEQTAGWERAERERLEIARQQEQARRSHAEALVSLASGASEDGSALATLETRTGLPAAELAASRTAAFGSYLERAVGDDILTPEEEAHVDRLVQVLGIDLQAFSRAKPDLARHAMIAQANGGVLPEIPSSRLIQKKGEAVHLELPATLLKDVAIRQSQGGYSGFSFPLGKTGIRYKVGGYRGHSVEVGTKRIAADEGVLVISSQRAVFVGNKKTLDLPYSKLLTLTLFSDGVQFHQSNRQSAPVFTVSMPDVVAAFVHAAAQRLGG
jgi:endogenous inhibitor of DNA gyrase (YacG/DUF329 family)